MLPAPKNIENMASPIKRASDLKNFFIARSFLVLLFFELEIKNDKSFVLFVRAAHDDDFRKD